MSETTQGYLNLEQGTLYYETAGSGEALLLSHAGFLDSRMFDAQWDTLAQHFRVIRYDMRGFGRSSAADGPICRRNDVRSLLQHLNVTQAHLVGCSLGGEILLDLALEQPELALSLILVGAVPGGFALQGAPPRYMMDMFQVMQEGDVAKANELQIRIWLDGQSREPGDVNGELRKRALDMNRIPVEQQTFFIADSQPSCPLNPPALTRIHNIQTPVLITVGELDHPEIHRAANVMMSHFVHARKVIIKDAGHVPSFEQPNKFNTLVLDFLHEYQSAINAE